MKGIKSFVFNFIEVNTYILYDDTREAAIIDCGCMTQGEEEQLSSFIDDNGLTVKRLLNTHYHFDHVLGNGFIYKRYGVKPERHRAECGSGVPDAMHQAARFGVFRSFTTVEPEHYIEGGEYIRFGACELKALLVPGHSPASLAYYCAKEGCVFTGDTLFAGDVGRSDLWGGDEETLLNSIRTQLFTLPPETVVYPGHGASTTIGYEIEHNVYLR